VRKPGTTAPPSSSSEAVRTPMSCRGRSMVIVSAADSESNTTPTAPLTIPIAPERAGVPRLRMLPSGAVRYAGLRPGRANKSPSSGLAVPLPRLPCGVRPSRKVHRAASWAPPNHADSVPCSSLLTHHFSLFSAPAAIGHNLPQVLSRQQRLRAHREMVSQSNRSRAREQEVTRVARQHTLHFTVNG